MRTIDEILEDWLVGKSLRPDDILPIMLEYNNIFCGSKFTEQEITLFLHHPLVQTELGFALNNALIMIAKKKGMVWTDVYNQKGKLVARFKN